MRKSINKTTVVIVLAIFLSISVGYALFSDTITIEGTATAQGNFDIVATCQSGFSDDLINAGVAESTNFDQDGYVNDSCAVYDKKVSINVGLEYPGATRVFSINLKNEGSMDSFIELVDDGLISALTKATLNSKITNTETGEITNKSCNYWEGGCGSIVYSYTSIGFSTIFKLSDGTFIEETDDFLENELFYKDTSGKKYLKLAPGQSLTVLTIVGWDKKDTVPGYSVETNFNLPFEFVQKAPSDIEIDYDAEQCLSGC